MPYPEWNGHCHRCGKETRVHTMSRYSTALICMDCEDAEKKRPDYKRAHAAEEAAVRAGDYNFPGIGEPS